MEVKEGYKATDVGVIPMAWDIISLLDLVDQKKELFDDGDWVEAEYLTTEGIRLIQTGNIGIGSFIDKEARKYISPSSFRTLRCKDILAGDVLICRLAEPAGRACVFPDIGEERSITSVDITIYRPPTSKADRRYLVNVFSTPQWFRVVNERCGGSTRSRIARSELGRINIPCPPLFEQRAIADALGDVDALIDGLERLIAKKRDLKQAAMQQLLTGKTRLPGFNGEWVVKRLGEIGVCIRGVTYKVDIDLYPYDTAQTIRLLRSNNVQDAMLVTTDIQYVNRSRVSEQQVLRADDILICMANGSKDLVGKAGLFKISDGFEYTFGAFMGCFRIKDENISSVFVFYLFQTERYRDYINNLLAGTSINNLGPTSIESLEFPIPLLIEQNAVAKVLSDMDRELKTLRLQLDKTRALKQAMMQELLTGRIRLV